MESTLRKTVRGAIVALAVAAALAPAALAQEDEFIPGYTDFPNALRIESETGETFVPGHTDFPNHLRFDSEYDRARYQSGLYGGVITVRRVSPGFDWNDAAIGAGGAAVVLILGAGLAALALRRPIRRTALTG
jgi:hypothetical protein